jgi:glycerophosphoryl diester phosphodiesterase
MDVQVTSDGTFVLMHDRTISRTTNGAGRIIDTTWARLRTVRLTDGQGVPTLARVMAMAQRRHVKVLVELKWVPSRRFASLRRLLGRFGLSRVVVNSFSANVVARWHDRYPGMATALDTTGQVSLARARSFGGVMPDHRHVTLAWLARLRRAGVPTYLWTVNKPADWARYRHRVTLLLTDRPAVYDVWRRRHC